MVMVADTCNANVGKAVTGRSPGLLTGFSRPVRDSREIKEGAWDSRNYTQGCPQLPHTCEHMLMCPCTHLYTCTYTYMDVYTQR